MFSYEEVGAHQIPGARQGGKGVAKRASRDLFVVLARYIAAHMGHWTSTNPFPQPRSQATRKAEAAKLHFPNKLFGKFVAIRYLTGTVSCPTSSAPAAPHLRRGTPRPPRGMASTPQRPPPPQRPPGPKSLLLGRPRNRSLRHLRGPEPPTRRLQPILPRKPSRTAAGRAEERRRGRGDRSAAEEAIEHPLVSAVPEQPLG